MGSPVLYVPLLGTGIAYFTWTVTGISLTFGLLITHYRRAPGRSLRHVRQRTGNTRRTHGGSPAWRPHAAPSPFQEKKKGLWAKLKALVADRYTWFSMLYMIVQWGRHRLLYGFHRSHYDITGLIAQPIVVYVFHYSAFGDINGVPVY